MQAKIYLALAGRLVTLLDRRGRSKGEGETAFSPAGTRGEFNFYSLRRKNCLGSKDRIPGCHFPRFGVYLFRDSTVQLFLSKIPEIVTEIYIGTVRLVKIFS